MAWIRSHRMENGRRYDNFRGKFSIFRCFDSMLIENQPDEVAGRGITPFAWLNHGCTNII